MRHVERNKWQETNLYDAAETSESRRGENEYFAEHFCLSTRGKVQAKMINEYNIKHDIKIGDVVSSPSCRARQTAELGFKKIDFEDKILVYKNVFYEDYSTWQKNLKKCF